MNTCRRPRDSRLRSGRAKRPDVEVLPMLLERRGREQNLYKPVHISFKLLCLSGCVAVAKNQKIYLCRRIATFLDRDNRRRRWRLRSINKLIQRIDDSGPKVSKDVPGI